MDDWNNGQGMRWIHCSPATYNSSVAYPVVAHGLYTGCPPAVLWHAIAASSHPSVSRKTNHYQGPKMYFENLNFWNHKRRTIDPRSLILANRRDRMWIGRALDSIHAVLHGWLRFEFCPLISQTVAWTDVKRLNQRSVWIVEKLTAAFSCSAFVAAHVTHSIRTPRSCLATVDH